MPNKDLANLLAILDAVEKILQYIQGITCAGEYYRNPMIFDATLMNFVVVGEMVDRLSTELRQQHAEVDWQRMKDFRNLVAHDYLGVDAEEVWQIIHTDLPELRSRLQAIARESNPQE